jgi:glycosyltransferase involved in cell wall biosynthesis
LLSAYDAVSHRLWRTSLATLFPEHDWTQLSLPPRYFSWRVRGNSLSWGISPHTALRGNYDLLIATSLVDLASLRGFLPHLAAIPTLVYFHENQFVYPVSNSQGVRPHSSHLDAAMVSLYSALCADRVVFNSHFNRRTFLSGVAGLLQDLPDHLPAGILERLQQATVLPVPLDSALPVNLSGQADDSAILQVVWNHRWEYDKGPELLLALAEAIVQQRLPFQLHILGQRFRQWPAEFPQLQQLFTLYANNGHSPPGRFGPIADRAEYYRVLSGCDVVLSTARHDFQGLSILEAAALGCTPLCPDALVYPEYLDRQFLYDSRPGDSGPQIVEAILARLSEWLELKNNGGELPKFAVGAFTGEVLRGDYAALFETLWQSGRPTGFNLTST